MKSDLTRWNRAGLKRLRYVDGNAATYLATLRHELYQKFDSLWKSELEGDGVIANGIVDPERALEHYLELSSSRGSIGLEIVRSFARASHVLTEHLNAYANEGFLGTATQWEYIRQLVQSLDYHPRPPASARTCLVLQAKTGQKGIVRRGFQVKHIPEDGGPVVFETLIDIAVDPVLNELRLQGWDRSREEVTVTGKTPLSLGREIVGLQPNEPIVVENKSTGRLTPFILRASRVQGGRSLLFLDTKSSINLGNKGDILVHLNPCEILQISGPSSPQAIGLELMLEDEPKVLKEMLAESKRPIVVFIDVGNQRTYGIIDSVSEKKVKINTNEKNANILKSSTMRECWLGIAHQTDGTISAKTLVIDGVWESLKGATIALEDNLEVYVIQSSSPEGSPPCRTSLTFDPTPSTPRGAVAVYLPPGTHQWKIDCLLDVSKADQPNELSLTSGSKRLARNDLCIIASGKNLLAGRISEMKSRSKLEINTWYAADEDSKDADYFLSQVKLSGKFKEQAYLDGWNHNETPAFGRVFLELETGQDISSLKTGRAVVVEQETANGFIKPFLTSIQSVDTENNSIELAEGLPADDGYTVGNTVIRANVVVAGHGETMPEKVLGSGDATRSNQEFLFDVPGVSFVPDSSQMSGMRADIRIRIDGETWTQVQRLGDSKPADPHYVVWMTEEGRLRIFFGDGVNGRRLPTGENNVRISYRLGSGLTGNLDSGLLTRPAHPDLRVESVRQPLPCEGGNDLESVASLRRNAPASVLTLERAVSVEDFANLAMSHSSVWAARAFERNPLGHERQIEVVVVPAQGRPLGELREVLREFLTANALPGVQVTLTDFKQHHMELHIDLWVDGKRYDFDAVQTTVRKQLLESFALKNQAIGNPVFLSDVYQRVESVTGVDHSVCSFVVNQKRLALNQAKDKETEGQVLQPANEKSVIFLAPDRLTMTCRQVEL